MRGQHFAAELKKLIKSMVGSPMTKSRNLKPAKYNLANSSHAAQLSGAGPGAKKALKRVNGVLLKPRRGAFGKSVRRKLKKKYVFFKEGKHFFRRSNCQSGARIGQKQKKRGVKVGNAGSCVLAQGEPKKRAK